MATQLIETKLEIKSYLDIDIKDDRYDDTEDAVILMDVVFKIDVDENGMFYDIYEIKNITFRYTGIKFTEDDGEIPTEIEGLVDDSWTKEINTDKTDSEYKRFVLDDVELDINDKKIIINFIY